MSRDHRKLRVFLLADSLALEIYRGTNDFPSEERFGLTSQIRRAAVSAASNIVEGCARRSTREYLHFLNVAAASAAEAQYLVDLSRRLGIVRQPAWQHLNAQYSELIAGLQALLNSL